jgi:type II secretory pathway pseudopilin PulG
MNVSMLLKNDKGMTIVNVLIAAAMMGGLALVIAQIGQNSSKIQRNAIENQDLNSFVNTVEKHMLNHEACKNTFNGIILANEGATETISEIKNFNDITVYSTTENPAPTYQINSMLAERTAGTGLDFKIELEKTRKGKSYGAEVVTKTIKLDASYNTSTGAVEKCFSQLDNAVSSACAAFGGTLNGTQCLGGELCNIQMLALENSMAGGTATLCEGQPQIAGIGLEGGTHSIYACQGLGGSDLEIQGQKLCVFSGDCRTGWTRVFLKTTNTYSQGDRNCGCGRPNCNTGGHSSWAAGRETCTHYNARKKNWTCTNSCQNQDGIKTVYAGISQSACK